MEIGIPRISGGIYTDAGHCALNHFFRRDTEAETGSKSHDTSELTSQTESRAKTNFKATL